MEGAERLAKEKLRDRNIENEMEESYLDYSMSVIVGRALPDIKDGLKPVHRRILYAMHNMGMHYNKPFKKCARIVGEVLGKYHPHGDTAVYDSLVRMVQTFSLRYPLINGQGNFGSVDGDGAAAMRYCITGDSLIVTENGLLRMGDISDKEKINLKILSKDKKINKASKWFDSGDHPTLKITTNKGYSLTGTYNHPVLTLCKDETGKPIFTWKLMENLAEGDFVVMDRSSDNLWPKKMLDLSNFYPEIKGRTKKRMLPKYLDNDLAFILGSFLSEGSMTKNKIEFCNTDKKWIDDVSDVWKSVFPDSKLHLFERKPSSYGKKDYYRLECHCLHTLEFLRNIGMEDLKSPERVIPKTILESPKEVVVSFLKSYFEGDGTITFSRKMVELGCCSKSKEMIKELQILLLRFGIDSFRRYDKYRYVWKLYIRGQRNVLRFYKELGFLYEHKSKKLEYVVCNYKKDSSILDYVPFISDYIRNMADSRFISRHNFDRYTNMKNNYGKVSSILMQETGTDYRPLFEFFLTYNYLFDQITSIEEAGMKRVYSIKVDSDCHSFVSNGFISHNTEARMARISEELLKDIEKKTVAFRPNFDDSLKEPVVLPAKIPNLLVNGSSGIAVGMATNIPPHNLGEVIDGVVATIDNPEIELDELMDHIKAPDFPTGGQILGINGTKLAYQTGKGSVVMRGKAEIEEKAGKERMIITEIPYMVNKSKLIENIANLVKEKKIKGITNLRDESDKDGMRIVIDVSKSYPANIILNHLYKHTALQNTFGTTLLSLVDNQPKILGLKEMIYEFIKFRKTVVTKRTKFDLNQAEEKAHILQGLLIALDNIDETVRLIKSSRSVEEASQRLIKRFKLSKKQSDAILDMKLQRLTSLERGKITDEHSSLLKLIEELKSILSSEEKIYGVIKKELTDIKDKYGDERRTEILYSEETSLEDESLIKQEDIVITMSHDDYVKRIPLEEYKQQNRGGKGVIGTKTKEGDIVKEIFVTHSHDYLLCFTDKGKIHWVRAFRIPEAKKYGRGKPIVNLLGVDTEERVKTIIPVKSFDQAKYVFFASKKGKVKKTTLESYSNPRNGGIIAIRLNEDDDLIDVRLTDGEHEIMIGTKKGYAIRFSEKDVRPMGRSAAGVRGIRVRSGDEVVGVAVVDEGASLFTVTTTGYGKRTNFQFYRQQRRGGKGVKNLKVNEKTGTAVGVITLHNDDEVMFMSENGMVIRTYADQIREIGRNTQGVRVMRLNEDDTLASFARVLENTQDDENDTDQTSG